MTELVHSVCLEVAKADLKRAKTFNLKVYDYDAYFQDRAEKVASKSRRTRAFWIPLGEAAELMVIAADERVKHYEAYAG